MTRHLFILIITFCATSLYSQDKCKDGESIYKKNCSICHSFDIKLIGSPLNDILARRKKDWIYKYISDDAEFSKTDSIAKRLSKNGNLTTTSHNFKNQISKKDFKKLICFLKTKQTSK